MPTKRKFLHNSNTCFIGTFPTLKFCIFNSFIFTIKILYFIFWKKFAIRIANKSSKYSIHRLFHFSPKSLWSRVAGNAPALSLAYEASEILYLPTAIWRRWPDLNWRQPAWQAGALTNWATSPRIFSVSSRVPGRFSFPQLPKQTSRYFIIP